MFGKVSKTNSLYFEEILAFKCRVFGKSNHLCMEHVIYYRLPSEHASGGKASAPLATLLFLMLSYVAASVI